MYPRRGLTTFNSLSGLINSGRRDTEYSLSRFGVWLVSDGGTTLTSINNPTLNLNNPKAPINMADVSAPAGLAAAGVLMLMLGARRRAT